MLLVLERLMLLEEFLFSDLKFSWRCWKPLGLVMGLEILPTWDLSFVRVKVEQRAKLYVEGVVSSWLLRETSTPWVLG